MKNLVITAVLALAAVSASALEIGVVGGSNFGMDRNYGGVTVGQNLGVLGQNYSKFGVEAGFERGTVKLQNQNTWTVIGSYKLGDYKTAGFSLKAGVAYINPDITSNGWAGRVGVGLSIPLTKQWSVGADYAYQFAEAAISQQSGNVVSLNTKYSF